MDEWASGLISARQRSVGPQGTTVGMLASKGGIGKTTLTLWIAEAMRTKHSVCVVDANMDNPTIGYLTEWFNRTAGIGALVGSKPPTDAKIEEALCEVKGLGHIIAGPQYPTRYRPERVAETLCHVLRYLRTRFEWVFVDLPVAGTETTMLTDFALQSGVLDLYVPIFSTENSDIMSVSSWFSSMQKPPAEGGCDLDIKKCVGVINKSDGTDMDHVWLQEKIKTNMGMNIAGHVPEMSGLGTARNNHHWQCPPDIRQHIIDFCFHAFGTTVGVSHTATPASESTNTKWWKRKKKAKTVS